MRIVAAWLLAAVVSASFIALTSIGPIIYRMGWRHGVHLTDVVILGSTLVLAAWFTVRQLGARRSMVAAERAQVSSRGHRDEQHVNGAIDA